MIETSDWRSGSARTRCRSMKDIREPERLQSSIAPELVAELEGIERDAWADIYAAAPDDIRNALGISHHLIDDGVLLICRALDHIQFDRIGGLGVAEPARAEALDQAIAAFDAAGVQSWVNHPAPGAGAPERP